MADAFGHSRDVLGPQGITSTTRPTRGKPLVSAVFQTVKSNAPARPRAWRRRLAKSCSPWLSRQATPHEGSVSLFHLDGGRQPIRQQDGRFHWVETNATKADVLALIEGTPQEFSPNVLLRPLVQDTLFPTVCYVSGPSELAYLGQLGQVYKSFSIPRPLIYTRASATLLDSNAMRFLGKHDFPLESLRAQDEAALNQLLEAQLPPTVEATFEDAARMVEERMEALAAAVPQIDTTLEGATRSTMGRMRDDLKKAPQQVIQAAKRKTRRCYGVQARRRSLPRGPPPGTGARVPVFPEQVRPRPRRSVRR